MSATAHVAERLDHLADENTLESDSQSAPLAIYRVRFKQSDHVSGGKPNDR